MVIRGGENIYPREIEEFLYTHPVTGKVRKVEMRERPDAVADLDASLQAALVGQREMELYLVGRRDRGIVQARRAVELADPRAESRPESQTRCTLRWAGCAPTCSTTSMIAAASWAGRISPSPSTARRRVRRGVARCRCRSGRTAIG